MRLALITLAAAALLAAPAGAQQTDAAPDPGPTEVTGVDVPGQAEPKVEEDPTICRKVAVTGSRISTQKVCKKQSEWAVQAKRRSGGGGDIIQTDCGGGSGCEIHPLPST